MAAVVNFIDTTLRGAATRNLADPSHTFVLGCSSPGGFKVAADGTAAPASITFSVVRLGLSAAATFAASDGATLDVAGDTAVLTYAHMPGANCTVTATITEDGVATSRPITVSKVLDGSSGATTYTWVKYADSAAGAGLSDDPTGKAYIGLAHNKTTATESTTASDYAWSLIKGTDGQPGQPGLDGSTMYTWIKYSDNADGTGLYDIPTANTAYLGIAVNKATPVESSVKTDYVWSKFKGDQGVPGTGTTGQRGAGQYYAQGNSWSDLIAEMATPGASVVDDQVVIWNGTNYAEARRWNGSAWVATGAQIPGDLIVPGTMLGNRIKAGTLEILKLDGTPILTLGGLQPGFEAPGTKNADLLPGINSAATTATWGGVSGAGKPQDNATVGADAGNLNVGLGGKNLLPSNTLPSSAAGYVKGVSDPATVVSTEPTFATGGTAGLAAYSRNALGAVYLNVSGTPPNGSYADLYYDGANKRPVIGGRKYELAFDISTHRCSGSALILWYDASNAYIGYAQGGGLAYAANYSVLDFPRAAVIATAPVNAASAIVLARMLHDGAGSNPYMFTSRWYFGEALAAQTVASPWTPSQHETLAAINDPATGIAAKLSKAGSDEINGTIALKSQYALQVGTANDGIFYGVTGIYGRKGGFTTFSIGADGTATYAGALIAAYGSFGAVSIAAGGSFGLQATGYNSDAGVWFGFVGGQPKLSIVASNGAKLLFDPTAPTPLQIVNATISNPTMDAFTATLSGNASGSFANGSAGYGTLTANPSGGKLPYSFRWGLTEISKTGAAGDMKINSTTSQSASFSGSGTNATLDYAVTCIVTDANGRTVTLGTEIIANHGTPP